MGRFLDFDKEEKGYQPFDLTLKNIRNNIGKKICLVESKDYCRYRGGYTVRYYIIHSVRYKTLYVDDGHNTIDIRDVLECGIEI
jgi:hypothetical protein